MGDGINLGEPLSTEYLYISTLDQTTRACPRLICTRSLSGSPSHPKSFHTSRAGFLRPNILRRLDKLTAEHLCSRSLHNTGKLHGGLLMKHLNGDGNLSNILRWSRVDVCAQEHTVTSLTKAETPLRSPADSTLFLDFFRSHFHTDTNSHH